MQERHIKVTRSARYYIHGTLSSQTTEVWFVCHGFAQLAARFLRRFETLQDDHRVIVAPEALNRFYVDTSPKPHGPDAVIGATWMTREDRLNEISDYVGFLDAVHREVLEGVSSDRPRILLLGFSQGAATVGRWVALSDIRADRLVLWSGHLPADTDPGASTRDWATLPVTQVWGSSDAARYAETIETDRARLISVGSPVDAIQFTGGHEIHQPTLVEFARNW